MVVVVVIVTVVIRWRLCCDVVLLKRVTVLFDALSIWNVVETRLILWIGLIVRLLGVVVSFGLVGAMFAAVEFGWVHLVVVGMGFDFVGWVVRVTVVMSFDSVGPVVVVVGRLFAELSVLVVGR